MSALLTIALLHWVVLLTPGPNVLVVSNLAAGGSRVAALFAALGVTAVAGIWSALAVFGVGSLFAAQPALRVAVQVAGGLYLLVVARRLWRSGGAAAVVHAGSPPAAGAAFRLGFATNILNPKSALFFGSIFATALPAQPSAPLLVGAIMLVVCNACCWHVLLAFTFSSARIRRAYARGRRGVGRIAAVLVGAFGVRLLVATARELHAR